MPPTRLFLFNLWFTSLAVYDDARRLRVLQRWYFISLAAVSISLDVLLIRSIQMPEESASAAGVFTTWLVPATFFGHLICSQAVQGLHTLRGSLSV
ncbi:hypothetical protein BDY21DRAFT_352863 [Lineolata rhizophorae]|uniref:Uncharacterized protein n=1 Tax=Lineolata rhizophorae TaxID=578093 RepID=A0A6A6NRP9_9PEZI|nr:hypothetical protein BDY21DRAFT_352863 [Lineolata rhizophorae]